MLSFLKEFFTPAHRHTEKSVIFFGVDHYWVGKRFVPYAGAITCYLHTCPECGEILEAGKNAKLIGEKFGNYYALRTSLKLGRKLFELKPGAKMAKFKGQKFGVFRKGYEFWFYVKDIEEAKQKSQPKPVNMAA